jgi:RNA polymerase sigma-70 factor (ECF subfamily)
VISRWYGPGLVGIFPNVSPFKRRRPLGGSVGGPPRRGSDLSDPELCGALREGEAWAAEVVYERVAGVVDGVLFRLLGPGDVERDDLSQQALERIISTIVLGQFSQGCSLRSWATLIAQHVAVDSIRARSRERTLFDRSLGPGAIELVAEDRRTPELAAELRGRVDRLMTALSTLNRARAEAFVLHDILGHDLAEIASLTGVSVAAAQSRLVRGRRELLRFISRKERD